MVSLAVLFYMFVFIFALIGAIRGWAKEVTATFSVFLALVHPDCNAVFYSCRKHLP